jgi:transaldolase
MDSITVQKFLRLPQSRMMSGRMPEKGPSLGVGPLAAMFFAGTSGMVGVELARQGQGGFVQMLNPAHQLRNLGQSLWLDNITRDILDNGTLKRYINELAITGLTSNPTIFDNAITGSGAYNDEIRRQLRRGNHGEALFFTLAIQDLSRAAELFSPIFKRTSTVDGYVSLEVSPLLAHDTEATVSQAKALYKQANLSNLLIKIPGTPEGLRAVEEAIFAGVPVNVTLLFSADQYILAAEAYLRGLERRVAANLSADVRSVASLFVSRSDVAVAQRVPTELRNKLGLAIGRQTYNAYRDILDSSRFQQLLSSGVHAQRLLFASTGTKDKSASKTFYVEGLAAPNTINTMPENALHALASQNSRLKEFSRGGDDSMTILAAHEAAGVNLSELAARLQSEGAAAFVNSWNELLVGLDSKAKVLS